MRSIFKLAVFVLFILLVAGRVSFVTHNDYAPFISVDPGARYFTSAVYILQGLRPYYSDSPGSAYYTLLALSLAPFKAYSLMHNADFLEYVYFNKCSIMLYLQFFTIFISLCGLYLFSRSVADLTKKEWSALFGLLLFFSLGQEHFKRLWFVSSEAFLLFISGIIFFLLSKYILDPRRKRYLDVSFLFIGLGFAAKLTIMPLALFLFFLMIYDLYSAKAGFYPILKRAVASFILVILGFMVGTAVLGWRVLSYFNFIFQAAIHSGTYHHGKIGVNFGNYLDGLMNTFNIFTLKGFFILLYLIVLVISFYYLKRNKNNALSRRLFAAGIISLVAFIIFISVQFLKPYRERYFIIGYLLLAFTFSLLCAMLLREKKRSFILIALAISVFCALNQWNVYNKGLSDIIKYREDMQQLMIKHKINPQSDIIIFDKWSVMQNENVFFMYGDLKGSGIYNRILCKYQPNILFYDMQAATPMVKDCNKRLYQGVWNYALIAKEVEDRFHATKVLNARIIDWQGQFYLMVPR